jgi:hypothetical protein
MTHYTVGIIVPLKTRSIKAYVDRQMAPYNENHGSARDIANPNARWDWYRIGGRWDGWITGNPQSSDNGFNFDKKHETVENNITTTEAALASDKIPHAIITPDGEWHEHGHMGWFAVMRDERIDWDDVARDILRKHPRHRIVILDAHI